MLYTSYFAKVKEIESSDTTCISIARNCPPWFRGICYKKVAPTQQMLNDYHMYHDIEAYVKIYNKILSELNPKDIVLDLIRLTRDKYENIILVCYETPDKFCHRHLLAEWLNDNNFPCKEYEV